MDKRSKWKILPKELFRLFLLVGICATLGGVLLQIVNEGAPDAKAAGILCGLAMALRVIGAIILGVALLTKPLERWQKNHPETEETDT